MRCDSCGGYGCDHDDSSCHRCSGTGVLSTINCTFRIPGNLTPIERNKLIDYIANYPHKPLIDVDVYDDEF